MRYRDLGRTAISVSLLGFGCSNLRKAVLRHGKNETIRLLRTALDQGINFFDTADYYGQGFSERLLGEAFGGRRDQVVLATKAGYRFAPFPIQTGVSAARVAIRSAGNRLPPVRKAAESLSRALQPQAFSLAYIEKALERSLRRLKTDYVDIFQFHNPPRSLLESGECFETLRRLKASGKARTCGVSVLQPDHAALCMKRDVDIVQLPVNPLQATAIRDFLPAARHENLGIIARQPFGSGGIWNESARWTQELNVAPEEFASQILRWVFGHDGLATVLVGMSTERHLRANIEAVNAPALSEAAARAMDRLAGLS